MMNENLGNIVIIKRTNLMLNDIEYRTVVVDPPWQPTLGATWNSRMHDKAGPQRFYDTMSVAEIIAHRPTMASQAHIYIYIFGA